MGVPFTSTQVLELAPDASSAAAARRLVTPAKWSGLGLSERAVWGECAGSGKKPYQVRVDLGGPAFKCSCPSRKFPCKHGLALLLLAAEQPGELTAGPPPDWVADWLAARAEREGRRGARTESRGEDPKARERRAASREKRVLAGLEELTLWLEDAVREGLGALDGRPYRFFDDCGARMTDAQAPGLARMVRSLASIGAGTPRGRERLLLSVGRIHLLAAAYRRRDALPEDLRRDVRSLVGWTEKTEEILEGEAVRDDWLVVGRRVEEEDRLRVQRTWLLGRATERAALSLSFAAGGAALDTSLVPGTGVAADLVFYPGAVPLRALEKERRGEPRPFRRIPGRSSIRESTRAYADALARQPWLDRFPLPLAGVLPVERDGEFSVRDGEGRTLPLAVRDDEGWRLLAVSGGRPVDLFGEWDGFRLAPLGVAGDGRFASIRPEGSR